jgi:putative polyketide hydroxylase
MKNIPVIIIGAGPVGLSMALALARQNINSIVIEKNPSTTKHPRARGVNVRICFNRLLTFCRFFP